MDIVIPEDKLGDFLTLDDAEEKAQYGESADYAKASHLSKQILETAQRTKDETQERKNVYKQMMDFKVRAVDFISIYIKQRGY